MLGQSTSLSQVLPTITDEPYLTLADEDPNCHAVYRSANSTQRTISIYRTDQGRANQEKRCDFLIVDTERSIAWYVELKGKNHWDTACEQLMATYSSYTEELGIPEENTYFRLVSSSARTGMRLFRSYAAYRNMMMQLPRSSQQFYLMFSSKMGLHQDYEDLDALSVIAVDADVAAT